MEPIIKPYIRRMIETSPKNSGETSMNLSIEIMESIINPVPNKGEERPVSFFCTKKIF